MRRLLRRRHTQEYFSHGRWTKDLVAAQDFVNTPEAIEVCQHEHLGDMEMVLQIGPEPTEYDVVVPLDQIETGANLAREPQAPATPRSQPGP